MAAAELEIAETETDRIERWRKEILESAGYGADAAAELALRQDIDLHHAVDLVKQGCPTQVALRILL